MSNVIKLGGGALNKNGDNIPTGRIINGKKEYVKLIVKDLIITQGQTNQNNLSLSSYIHSGLTYENVTDVKLKAVFKSNARVLTFFQGFVSANNPLNWIACIYLQNNDIVTEYKLNENGEIKEYIYIYYII